jgi:hypothetical protein
MLEKYVKCVIDPCRVGLCPLTSEKSNYAWKISNRCYRPQRVAICPLTSEKSNYAWKISNRCYRPMRVAICPLTSEKSNYAWKISDVCKRPQRGRTKAIHLNLPIPCPSLTMEGWRTYPAKYLNPWDSINCIAQY